MGVQYVAAVTYSCVIDKDIDLAVTSKDLLCGSVHCVSVSQVKNNSAGCVGLEVKQNS